MPAQECGLNSSPRIPPARRTDAEHPQCASTTPGGGSSGRFGLAFCFGLASMLFSALRFDIGAHLIKRCATHTTDIVSPMPELRLAIERSQMLSKAVSRPSRAGSLEMIDQHRNIKCRMGIDQQMDMISFTTELKQLAAPSSIGASKARRTVVKPLGASKPAGSTKRTSGATLRTRPVMPSLQTRRRC